MKWIIPKHDGIPLVEWLYSQRNIAEVQKYFTPTFKDLDDPLKIYDMTAAVEFISQSIKDKKKIFIHGDFDADGITATSILWMFLYNEMKANVIPYIPSRFYEGYGLTEESVGAIKENGGEVIITVDCGVKDIELINKYHHNIDFIVTDHHTIRDVSEGNIDGSKQVDNYIISSKAKAVIHPALSSIEFKDICGAMVSFKLCCALNQSLNLNVDMLKYADLCSIGTVCDVMPLVNENRTIVQLGLEQMNRSNNLGLEALKLSAGVKGSKINAYHIGFVFGPRLNAAGRLGDALDAVRLLTTSSRAFASQMAAKLEALNSERKRLTEVYLETAEKELRYQSDIPIFIHFGEDWPEGILGLIAGKLSDKYSKPVIIGSKGSVFKASARSPEGFHVTEFIGQLAEYLEKFGGHAQAAGLTVKQDSLETFIAKANELAKEKISEPFEKLLYLDASLDNLSELNIQNAEQILRLEPFGTKNPKPIIYLGNVKLKNYNLMGQNKEHLKLILTDDAGRVVEALSFGNASKYTEILNSPTLPLEFAVTLELDEWNGSKKPSLRIVDFRINN